MIIHLIDSSVLNTRSLASIMAARILDGRACAAAIEESIKNELAQSGLKPHLAVVIVGDDPASHVYVNAKIRACERLGYQSTHINLPASSDESELIATINTLNNDESVNGILVQSPLPAHMDEEKITDLINPAKDVDGFHPQNLGRLVQGRLDGMLPCTPAGIMKLLEHNNISTQGKNALVIGRSRIVGMPLALLLAAKGSDATVSIAHSRTKDIESLARGSDIVIAAVGQSHFVKPDWIKQGCVVIDVGINRNGDGGLEGDVDPQVANFAEWLTPVPGGVGPMTIAMLMENTLRACGDIDALVSSED